MKSTLSKRIFSILVLSLAFSGCRFGNHADEPQPLKNSSQKAEFFYSSPRSFTARVILNSIGGSDSVVNSNPNAALSLIPSNVLNALSNPVFYLITPEDSRQKPFFADYTYNYGLTTRLDASENIIYGADANEGLSEVDYLWSSSNCLTQYKITQEGNLDRSHATSITYSDGTSAPVGGSVNFTYTYSRVIDGSCTADLTYLGNCYTNGTGCSSQAISTAKLLFDVYKQAGVLNMSDVAKIKALEYIVHYE